MSAARSGLWPRLLLALAFAAQSPAAKASDAEAQTALCDRAIVRGATTAGIPASVLNAVSLTETGRNQGGRLRPWPWAINREGQGYWFATREQALAFAQASLAEGRTSFDVGCFQINYRWHGHNFPSLEAMFDQEAGADYAARFLRDLHGELGDWSRAAGAYHSRTPEYAQIYRARFDRILASVGDAPLVVTGDVGASPAAEPATPRKSRVKLARPPLIITIDKRQFAPPLAAKGERASAEPPVPAVLLSRNEMPRPTSAF
ncbi:lytic transglycosylase domain-containing protein [Amaricoccus sp.]|uniref:lytic transglycosylase domain-containing protein n=1 Tax=Amaricoccus sp. TaxID=1872485 RepID=UPI002621BA8B|nr:lytic transglycosylase domain-containing protein [uncultured Amaricoccus sp.]